MRFTLCAGLLVAAVGASASQTQPISGSDPVWAQATDYLCRSDDNVHLERNADEIIRDIGVATVDDAANRGNPTALFLRGFGEYRRLGGFVRSSGVGKNDLLRSARAGHPLGAIWYATDYVNPNRRSEVMGWLKRGAQPGCPFGEFVYAFALSENPEPKLRIESQRKGLLMLEELANEGYATAQLVLSTYLRSGKNGARIDHPRALKLLTAAADDGLPAAMSALAYSYLDGTGVARDAVKAIEILLKIAEVGDPNRYAEVGELYLAGKDIPRNLDKAQQYFDLATKNGVTVNAASIQLLARLVAARNENQRLAREREAARVMEKEKEALAKRDAERARAIQAERQAKLRAKQQAEQAEGAQAQRARQQTASSNPKEVQSSTGAQSQTRNRIEAREALARGQISLEQMAFTSARTHMKRACEGGEPAGCDYWARLLILGRGGPRNLKEGYPAWRRACEGGLAMSCRDFAWTLEQAGLVAIPEYRSEILDLYKKGCDLRDAESCSSMKRLMKHGAK